MAVGVIAAACSTPSATTDGSPVLRTANAQAGATAAVPAGSVWSYLDTGEVPAGWADPSFDVSGWASAPAPLGAGNPGLRTVINRTSPPHLADLFRTTFEVPDPSAVSAVAIRMMADDAALVSINGVQVLNDNVQPNGYPVTYRGSTTGESDYRTFTVEPAQLRAGTNVVAVELRQDYRNDVDSGFDLELALRSPEPTTTTTTPVETTSTLPAETTTTTTTSTTTTTTTTTTVAPPPPTTAPPAGAAAPPGWGSLLWSDEFSGAALNTATWKPYHSTYGDGNKELQCLTPNNVAVSGGTLKITAKREQITCPGGKLRAFTSGFLGTRETGTYFPAEAYYEIRARIPHAQGLWPAFWLRHRSGSSTAEVDAMEYFHSQVPGKTTQTLHLNGVSNVSKKTTSVEAPTTTPGWHTWGVAIEPVAGGQRFTFYTDGVAVHTYVDTNAGWTSKAPANGTFDIAVNMAVGGNWVGHPDDPLGVLSNLSRCAQGGTYPDACRTTGIRRAAFPATYEVDYVRVFTR